MRPIDLSSPALPKLAQETLDYARKYGATEAEVSIGTSHEISVEVRQQTLEKVSQSNSYGFDVTVYFDKQSGSASSTDFYPEAIELTVKKACEIARETSIDPYSGLPEKDLLAFNYPDLDLYHPWDINPQQAFELAMTGERIGLLYDDRISNSEGMTVSTTLGEHCYANTHGFLGCYSASSHYLGISLVALANGSMERDYSYISVRDPELLIPLDELVVKAARQTLARLNARKITTRRCPVIFSARVARSLLGHFISAIMGGNLYRRNSFLVDRLDTLIFPEYCTIREDPHIPKAIGSVPFDAEGVVTYPQILIDKGKLRSYLLGSYSARKLGLKSTGNAGGAHNVIITTDQPLPFTSPAYDADSLYYYDTVLGLNALLEKMGTGLLVTELIGQGVNILTGDYSRGAVGFWVEDGVIQYPVDEITVAGNLETIFKNLVAVGEDVDRRGNLHTGSWLVGEMMVAGA